jgi:hypothetical protein
MPPHDNLRDGGRIHPLLSSGLARPPHPELSERLAAGLRTRVAPWLSIARSAAPSTTQRLNTGAYAHRHQKFSITSL